MAFMVSAPGLPRVDPSASTIQGCTIFCQVCQFDIEAGWKTPWGFAATYPNREFSPCGFGGPWTGPPVLDRRPTSRSPPHARPARGRRSPDPPGRLPGSPPVARRGLCHVPPWVCPHPMRHRPHRRRRRCATLPHPVDAPRIGGVPHSHALACIPPPTPYTRRVPRACSRHTNPGRNPGGYALRCGCGSPWCWEGRGGTAAIQI